MSEVAPVPNHTQVPEELRARDQWLLWDLSAERRRPFTLTGHGDLVGASWTNPDSWLSYERAHEYATANESVGIGYVLANDNEDYPRGVYGGLDLDGCITDGQRAEWLESIQPFIDRDAFVERSASGTGLHVIVAGFSPPGWWSDCGPAESGDHQGVEAYGSKFFAFTGDVLDAAGVRVMDDGQHVTDWLKRQYERLTDERPWESGGPDTSPPDDRPETPANIEETGNVDEISRAIDRLNAQDVAEKTIVYEWNDGHAGDGLKAFKPTWGPNSNGTANIVGEDGWTDTGTNDASGGPLEMAAIDMGDLSHRGCSWGDADGEMWWDAVDHLRDLGFAIPEYEPPEHVSGSRGVDSTSDFTELDEDEVKRGEAILQSQSGPEDPVGDLDYHNGGYGLHWENRDDDGNVTSSGYDMVTNFTLETLSFLETEERRSDEFVVRVHPNHPTEQPYDVRVAPSVFNSADKFRDEIVLGRTTWFDPSNRKGIRTVTLLRHLRETVGAQPAPHRTGQPYVGLSADYEEFVTPNGSLTADGWTDDPEFEFYSKGGAADSKGAFGDKWVLDPEDEPDVDDGNVARICELLWQTRKAERGLPMLGWFYVAPIKALIHEWEGEFPLLSPHGDTGTGKTATIETFCRAFGLTGEPLSATDTRFTIQKHISESRGAPVWFDEYKPTEMGESQLDHLHQRLKEVTKERTMSKGRPDLDMVQLHLRAPVVLSGEQKVADPAVRRRTILTNLSREPTRDGTPTKAAFGELTGTAYEDADGNQHYPEGYDLDEHSRRFYQWVLDYGTENLREKWNTAREKVKQVLEQFGVTVEASEERGLQTIIFGVALYKSFATEVGADEEKLPDDKHIREACRHVIDNIGKGGQRREHTDEFLEVCSLAASDGYLENGVHHRLLDSQNHGCEVLAFHMPTVFSTVKKYVRDSNLENEYSILSKTDYLNSFRNKSDAPGTEVLETNKRTQGLENGGKAVHFDHEAITDKLGADFNVDAFRPPEERESADVDEVTPISGLTPDGNPYTDITVRVNTWDAGPDGGPAESGVMQDATGTVDVVDFFGTTEAAKLEEGDYFRLENARVGTYDGAIQVEIVQNTTTVTPIQAGSGTTASPDPDGDADDVSQSSLEAAADGGTSSAQVAVPESLDEDEAVGATDTLRDHVRTTLERDETVTEAKLAGALTMDKDALQYALERLCNDGTLIRDEDGYRYNP